MNLETNGMDQVVVITIMTVVVWVIVRFAAIRQFMFRRKVLDDTELSGLFAANDLDASKVLMILRIIGRCYGIPYGVLRPGDCFNGNLWNLDQWKLGFGTRNCACICSRISGYGYRFSRFGFAQYQSMESCMNWQIGRQLCCPMAGSATRKMPNQLPDPTSPSVTPPARAGGAPAVAADH